jgi:hypothetical protein
MENITYITDPTGIETVLIDHGNGEFTSMHKSTYDELKANEAAAK